MVDSPGGKEKPKKSEEITLKLSPTGDPRMGRVYANYVQISHNPWEFTVRFCLAPPGGDIKKSMKGNKLEIPIIIDIMVPPALIPGFIKALQTNYGKFEKRSEISIPTEAESTTH